MVLPLPQSTTRVRRSRNLRENEGGPNLPPAACCHRDPPAFYLTELRVGHFHQQWEAGHPDTHLQLGVQKSISEVQHHVGFSSCFFSIYKHGVTTFWYLDKSKEPRIIGSVKVFTVRCLKLFKIKKVKKGQKACLINAWVGQSIKI